MPKTTSSSRDRQKQWRDKLPEMHRIVEQVAPQMWAEAEERVSRSVPEEWKKFVGEMREHVQADAVSSTYHDAEMSSEERRGYHWGRSMRRVEHMIAYLLGVIRDDLGFEDDATLATMVLLEKAMDHLQAELQDVQAKPRDNRLEQSYRVQQALFALTPRFDDVQMRRLRALQRAESAAALTSLMDDSEIERRVQEIVKFEGSTPESLERSRAWFNVTQPTMNGVMARSWLVEVDEKFASLDPLVVMEEFADATAEKGGGRTEGGEGRTGAARALARLSVMCGALELSQKEGEDFDTAVERGRANLLMARSRIRKETRGFPGQEEEG